MAAERTKERIVQAAIRVISQKGYDNSSVGDILREAKISKGTFYRYFKSKRDLLDRACRDFLTSTDGEWNDFITRTDDPVKGLEYHVDFILAIICEEKTATTYFELWAMGVRSEAGRKTTTGQTRRDLPGAGVYRQLRGDISRFYSMAAEAGNIKMEIDPSITASLMIALMDGICTQYLLDPDAIDLKRVRESIKRIFIYDLIKPSGRAN